MLSSRNREFLSLKAEDFSDDSGEEKA